MKTDNTGPHLDHFFKQTREHHVQLSAMADFKANLMMTVSSLVITFGARYLEHPILRWPAIVMMLFCMFTVLFAILAVMPRTLGATQRRRKPDVNSPAFNLLFFGSFVNLSYEEYRDATEEVINNPGKVFEAMTKEIYGLGVFLAKTKYRYLRWSYLCFIAGMISSSTTLLALEIWTFTGRA